MYQNKAWVQEMKKRTRISQKYFKLKNALMMASRDSTDLGFFCLHCVEKKNPLRIRKKTVKENVNDPVP